MLTSVPKSCHRDQPRVPFHIHHFRIVSALTTSFALVHLTPFVVVLEHLFSKLYQSIATFLILVATPLELYLGLENFHPLRKSSFCETQEVSCGIVLYWLILFLISFRWCVKVRLTSSCNTVASHSVHTLQHMVFPPHFQCSVLSLWYRHWSQGVSALASRWLWKFLPCSTPCMELFRYFVAFLLSTVCNSPFVFGHRYCTSPEFSSWMDLIKKCYFHLFCLSILYNLLYL